SIYLMAHDCSDRRVSKSLDFVVRQPDAILLEKCVVDGDWAQLRSKGIAYYVRNHHRQDHRVIVGHFENHYYRSNRSPDNTGEHGAHADECECAGLGCEAAWNRMSQQADDPSQHSPYV